MYQRRVVRMEVVESAWLQVRATEISDLTIRVLRRRFIVANQH